LTASDTTRKADLRFATWIAGRFQTAKPLFGAVLPCKYSAMASRAGRWATLRMRCQH